MSLDVGAEVSLQVGNADDRTERNHADETDDADENGSEATGNGIIVCIDGVKLFAAGSAGQPSADDHAGSGPDVSAG